MVKVWYGGIIWMMVRVAVGSRGQVRGGRSQVCGSVGRVWMSGVFVVLGVLVDVAVYSAWISLCLGASPLT